MNHKNIRDWLEGIGIVAVVASLMFVGFQIRQDRKIAIVETFSNRTEFKLEIANLIGSHHEVWIAGLDGKELNSADYVVFEAIAKSVESFYLYQFARAYQIGTGSPDLIAQKYAFVLYQYPGLSKIWVASGERVKARKQAFDQPGNDIWLDAVSAQIEKLESLDIPALPEKVHSIF